ncbi:hypothetical protein GQ457_16G003810 [Hibiscus cannabinus]
MQAIKTKVDELTALGKPLDAEDLIEKILDGIDDSYQLVIDAVNNRETLTTFDELHEKLINMELALSTMSFSGPITAHSTHTQRSNQRSNRSNTTPISRQQNRPMRPFLGKCQWCRAQGHVVTQCSLFRQQFPNASPPTRRNTSLSSHAPPPWQPLAHVVTSTSSPNDPWLLDTGATHHITTYSHNISLHNLYTGPNEIMIGDGSRIPITHTRKTLDTFDPRTAEVIAKVSLGDAFDHGPWPRMSGLERGMIMMKFADLIQENAEEIAALDTVNGGKLFIFCKLIDIATASRTLRYYARAADKIHGTVLKLSKGLQGYTLKEPIGVVGSIIPWNFPTAMFFMKTAPALAAGCTIILKPAEQTPLSALYYAHLAKLAGVPDGVLNVVNGYGCTTGAAISSYGH